MAAQEMGRPLAVIARAAGGLRDPKEAAVVAQVRQSAGTLDDERFRQSIAEALTEVAAKSGQWRQAREYAAMCESDSCKASAEVSILRAWAGLDVTTLEEEDRAS